MRIEDAGEYTVSETTIGQAAFDVAALEAIKTAEKIAGYSRVAVVAAKEVVNKSQELALKEGVEYERRLFHGLFGSRDQKIGEFVSSYILFQC